MRITASFGSRQSRNCMLPIAKRVKATRSVDADAAPKPMQQAESGGATGAVRLVR